MARRRDNTGPIIEQLKREYRVTDQQLDTRIEQHDLPLLASCFNSIDDGCLLILKLNPGQQSDVREKKSISGTSAAMMLALQQWLNAQLKGTFRALIVTLLSLESQKSVAVKVFAYLSGDDDPPPSVSPGSSNDIVLNSTDKGGKFIYLNRLYGVVYKHGRSKWRDIGSALDMDHADLTAIENDKRDSAARLNAMLDEWFLANDKCYLSTFLEALEAPNVHLINLASQVKEAFISA